MMEFDNIERYDRQIRLWGQHGQNKCSNGRICLINANSLGSEILKGLCLAGIGAFTILDSNRLTPENVGCCFMSHSYIGKNRGESVRSMLLNLNEEVKGEARLLETHLPHLDSNDNSDCSSDNSHKDLPFWKQFNCVVACGFLYSDQITRLSKICWTLNIPLILCKSIGFFGFMRCQTKEHLIIETHPDNILPDFNLDKPFKDLSEYFHSINLEDDSNLDRINSYPYIVIVYHYLKLWQQMNEYPQERLPNSYKEKQELKSMINEGLKVVCEKRKAKKSAMTNSQDEPDRENILPFENYIEASKAVNSCFTTSKRLPENVEKIFSKVSDSSARHSSSSFWIIIKAIKEFVINYNNGVLPVSGSIPDMISSSEEYIKLQTVYSKKAKEDSDKVFTIVQNLSGCLSSNNNLYEDTQLICKNIRDLKVITTCPIYQDYDLKTSQLEEGEEENEFITIGLCLTAVDLFFSIYGRLPGYQDDQVEPDVSKLKECVKQIVGKTLNRFKTLDQTLYEVCRYGGAELHATSAFLGGCIGQEIIKIITHQYIPVDDTLVYNAIIASTRSFKYEETFIKT